MTKSVRLLLMGAAMTGFIAGQTAMAQNTGGDKSAESGKKATKSKKDKHACKGQNSCKGKGGCGQPRAKMIAKAKASAGQTASPCPRKDNSGFPGVGGPVG